MADIDGVLRQLSRTLFEQESQPVVTLEEYLKVLAANPSAVMRNVFQLFHDMVRNYVEERPDEYQDDPESINFVNYDCSKLFVENSDRPFFADRLFANRLMRQVAAIKSAARQNKIYIFKGPPGSGKSTLLNNLLMKFEEYTNTDAGRCYEVVWRLDRRILASFKEHQVGEFMNKLSRLMDEYELETEEIGESRSALLRGGDFVEVPCPSHDSPLLMVDKRQRRAFFDDLLQDDRFKRRLFNEKEYDWVFRSSPCTICTSLFKALSARLEDSADLFRMIQVRPYRFDRRHGMGISVFNASDQPIKHNIFTNELLQKKIDHLLGDSNTVNFIYSRFPKTNNGIYALMDLKSHNVDRLYELQNIISEGVHNVEGMEEKINSLFLATMNPDDEHNLQLSRSLSNRVVKIKIAYVLDIDTETSIYENIFGTHSKERFLPWVLRNFARIVVSTRLNKRSDALLEWIGSPDKYQLYCDENLQILKMEIYSGHVPSWLSEDDQKGLTPAVRRRILEESETEGESGFSGYEAVSLFNEFLAIHSKKPGYITMSDLFDFFTTQRDLQEAIPSGFLESLQRNYDYTVVQEIRQSFCQYDEHQISRDIENYLTAVLHAPGTVITLSGEYCAEEVDLLSLEKRVLGVDATLSECRDLRKDTALTQKAMGDPLPKNLLSAIGERYLLSLRRESLASLIDNESLRWAIKDFGQPAFENYPEKLQEDVSLLITKLSEEFPYTKNGAKKVCIYVIDNDLVKKFRRS